MDKVFSSYITNRMSPRELRGYSSHAQECQSIGHQTLTSNRANYIIYSVSM